MFDRISHIGVIVKDMDAALVIWQDQFGLKKFGDMKIDVEGIRSVFLSVSGKPGEMTIELMEPADQSDMTNPVARRLASHGEGFYHLAVVVDGVDKSTQDMKDKGQEIYFIHYQRDETVSRHHLPTPAVQRGFRFDWQKAEND